MHLKIPSSGKKKVFPRHVKPFEGSSLLWKKLCHPRTWSCRVFDILTQLGTCNPALQMVKTPKKAFVKRRKNFKGDWTHLLSITFKQTDKICCCNFRRVTKSGDFLLVQSLQCLFFFSLKQHFVFISPLCASLNLLLGDSLFFSSLPPPTTPSSVSTAPMPLRTYRDLWAS